MFVRQFIVAKSITLDDSTYRQINVRTFCENNLRVWAKSRWNTPLNATFNVVARDIKQGGWDLFEYTIPADADPESDEVSKLLDKLDQSNIDPESLEAMDPMKGE